MSSSRIYAYLGANCTSLAGGGQGQKCQGVLFNPPPPGGYRERATPPPNPNTAVKGSCADGYVKELYEKFVIEKKSCRFFSVNRVITIKKVINIARYTTVKLGNEAGTTLGMRIA